MRCYCVTCVDGSGNTFTKGVITDSSEHAKLSAERAFLEGQQLNVAAINVEEVNGI